MNLGEKILEMRTKANMSQGDLADVLKVSRQSVSKWETNSSVPELDKILKMSEIFKISIDELVHGDKEELSEESMNRINNEQRPRLETQKLVGVGLLGIGVFILILMLVLGDILSAMVFSSPFLVTGFICLIVKKHTGLWNGWILYLMVYIYLTYATGIRPWWIFNLWVYQNGLTAHAVIAWLMVIGFLVLIISTYNRIKIKNR